MRGGASCRTQRYSKDNTKFLKSYDKGKPSKNIVYRDAIICMNGHVRISSFKQI